MRVVVTTPEVSRDEVARTGGVPGGVRLRDLPEARWAALATALFAVGAAAQLAGAIGFVWWALYLCCYLAGGWEPGFAGLRALRVGRLDVDLLMVAAAVGAAAIGQVFDGALLIVIFATSGALEAFAAQRTAAAVRGLLDVTPSRVTRLTDAEEEPVHPAELVIGDVVIVRPGERIGADGRVRAGHSDVDQATITGEPLPAVKGPGDEVFAGTLNGTGALRVRVTRTADDTVVARIAAMVEQASATKARTQLLVEKVEQRYSVGMVAATLAIFAIPLALGAALEPTLLRAMTFMIVASPCAVVLATMPPLLAAIANAGQHGVLVKSAVVMERLATATAVAFDKTGTLTEGTPGLVAVRVVGRWSVDEVLARAAAVERGSEHPLAAAVVGAARDRGLAIPAATRFRSAPGRRVTAEVEGDATSVGHPATPLPGDVGEVVEELETAGYTAVPVTVGGIAAGVLGFTDQVRRGAPEVVEDLASLTGRSPVLLTGDNARAAGALAGELGIAEVHAGLLPADKVDRVRGLEDTGVRVVVVGDGVNDAPALAAAHTSMAMGRAGSDLALETADAVVVRDEIAAVPALLALARRARRVVLANLVIAATFISVLVAWDLLGHLPLPLGVAGHEGSTILVALNGLRLLRSRAWRAADGERT